MSYRNPQQYVDTTSAQHFQNLQSTIAGSFANVAKSFAEDQRRIQAENKQRDKENKLIKKGVSKEVSFLNRTLYSTDNKYPEVDFAELYNPLVKEFEDLSLKVEMGTSENPAADKTRLDQIYASVTGITDTLGNLVSFTEDYDEKMDNLNKPGGVYGGGMDPNVNLGLNIFMQKLPGKRVPRFENGDMNKFVWDIYDDKGELVQTLSKQRLDQISKGIDEMVTIIPKTEKDLTAVQKANPNIFQTEQNTKTGEMLPNGKINDKFLGKSKNVYFAKGDTRKQYYTSNKEVNKYDEGGIIFDPNFNATMDSEIASTLGEGETDKSAIALHNTQFNKVKYTKEDFLNNPTFKDKGWTEETLPQFIKDVIEDKENDGFEFDIDGNLDEDEQAVFNVAYKKNFLDKKVPNYMQGEEQFEVKIPEGKTESTPAIQEQRDLAIYLQKTTLPLFTSIDDSTKLIEEINKFVPVDISKDVKFGKDGKSMEIGTGKNKVLITSNMTQAQIKSKILRATGMSPGLVSKIDFSSEAGLLANFDEELTRMAEKRTNNDLDIEQYKIN